jgi:serpin B
MHRLNVKQVSHTVVWLLGLAIGFSACQNAPIAKEEVFPPKNENSTSSSSQEDASEQLLEGNHALAFTLMQTMYARENADTNLLISPLSLGLNLAMLGNGAVGETKTKLMQALGLGLSSLKGMNRAYHGLIEGLCHADAQVNFESANAAWTDKDNPFLPGFQKTAVDYYAASVRETDFQTNSESVAQQLNEWCNTHTHGMISKFVSLREISPIDFFIANVLYFKGNWTLPFPKEDTQVTSFHNQDGSIVDWPLMKQQAVLPYYRGKGFQAVELPYGNGSFCMDILLPDTGSNLPALMEQLELERDFLYKMDTAIVNISLPRFQVAYERILNKDMESIGLQGLFSTARFDSLRVGESHLQWIKQAATLLVDEEGTEASALNSVGGYTDVEPPHPLSFIVNRPFVFFIREKQSGHHFLLFSGVIRHLTPAEQLTNK